MTKVYLSAKEGCSEKDRDSLISLIKKHGDNFIFVLRGQESISSCDRIFFDSEALDDLQKSELEEAELSKVGILGGDLVPIKRIRRITGYLVSGLERFNAGKRAEERMRVKHKL